MIRFALAAVLAAQWFGGAEKNTREGAEHFENGRLEEALRAFSRSEGEFPEAPQNDLNLAGVHYRMGEMGQGQEAFVEAVRGYRAALAGETEGMLRRDALFNLGNTLFRSGAFADAAGAYGEAIALDPGDLEARQNLERALRRAEEESRESEGVESQEPEATDGEPRDGEPRDGEAQNEETRDGEAQDEEPRDGEAQDGEPDPGVPERGDPQPADPGADEPSPADDSGTAPAPEISPEQADRILAALAEVEAAFHEGQLEKRRARALRRGRH